MRSIYFISGLLLLGFDVWLALTIIDFYQSGHQGSGLPVVFGSVILLGSALATLGLFVLACVDDSDESSAHHDHRRPESYRPQAQYEHLNTGGFARYDNVHPANDYASTRRYDYERYEQDDGFYRRKNRRPRRKWTVGRIIYEILDEVFD